MTTETKTLQVDSWADKIGCPVGNPQEAIEMLQEYWKDPVVICLTGSAGIGKTEIPRQVAARKARELGIDPEDMGFLHFVVHTESQETFCGIPFFGEGDLFWSTMPSAKMAKELEKPYGILFLDELNREVDKSKLANVFSFLSTKEGGGVKLGEGWTVVAAMNPSTAEYSVSSLEEEAAWQRRLCFFYVDVEPGQWLRWAAENEGPGGVHPQVRLFIQNNPESLLDKAAQASGKLAATPATWTNGVSQAVYTYEAGLKAHKDGLRPNPPSITALRHRITGMVGQGHAQAFMSQYDYVPGEETLPTAQDVLTKFHTDEKLAKLIKDKLFSERIDAATLEEYTSKAKEGIDAGQGDSKGYIFSLLRSIAVTLIAGSQDEFIEFFGINPEDYEDEDDLRDAVCAELAEPVSRFLVELPGELYFTFVTLLNQNAEEGEPRLRMISLASHMYQKPHYQEYTELRKKEMEDAKQGDETADDAE